MKALTSSIYSYGKLLIEFEARHIAEWHQQQKMFAKDLCDSKITEGIKLDHNNLILQPKTSIIIFIFWAVLAIVIYIVFLGVTRAFGTARLQRRGFQAKCMSSHSRPDTWGLVGDHPTEGSLKPPRVSPSAPVLLVPLVWGRL